MITIYPALSKPGIAAVELEEEVLYYRVDRHTPSIYLLAGDAYNLLEFNEIDRVPAVVGGDKYNEWKFTRCEEEVQVTFQFGQGKP